MPRIAVTGHMNLTTETVSLVTRAIADLLAQRDEITGISCLARGADSIFAQEVLSAGGRLEAVIPAADYRTRKVKPDHAQQFDELLAAASIVRVMPFNVANRAAYEAANEMLLSSCDELFAVWDGNGSLDKGGTAEVVSMARARGIPVEVIWPGGAARVR